MTGHGFVKDKKCSKCGETKAAECFSLDRKSKSGLQSQCKLCISRTRSDRYWGDEEYRNKQREMWRNYAAQPEVRKRKTAQLKATGNKLHTIARAMVGTYVARGKIPAASSLVCCKCGLKQAEQYHHYNGYEKEHWFDIEAVCKDCHGIEHWRKDKNG